jgi:predicted kinase
LVLINGLPGSGKSTLARRYAEDHPLALVLDVDVVRGLLGAWPDDPANAGMLARDLALTMARVHLVGGRDVVVPQFLGGPDFVAALADVAAGVSAPFVEVVLLVEPAEAARRLAHRSEHPARRQDRDHAAMLERQGTVQVMPELRERLLAVVTARPDSRPLDAGGDVDSTYLALRAVLDS